MAFEPCNTDKTTTRGPLDGSAASGAWPIRRDIKPPVADRTVDLRKKVLAYRTERPRDPSVAQAVDDALTFIDLVPARAALPQVALADDGEVNCFWRQDGLLIDVGFAGDGMMHYHLSNDADGVSSDDSIEFRGRSLPQAMAKAIPRRVY